MNRVKKGWGNGLTVLVMLALAIAIQAGASAAAEKPSKAKVVFYVACYDVGKAALIDLKGVKLVQTGFKNSREIDTVYYDPEVITVKQMEEALKKARTYVRTEKEDRKS